MAIQKEYNNKILKNVTSNKQREEITQDLALCTHAEISSLVNATNYKKHHGSLETIDRDTILCESVDIIRYVMAIMNVWDIKSEEFEHAFKRKDDYLWLQHWMSEKKWNGEPVAIVDIDDVLAEFRCTFAKWLVENFEIEVDVESEEYYFISALSNIDENPELIFEKFVKDGGFYKLPTVNKACWFLDELKRRGYWIHLLTARPKEDLKCFYDTFVWLKQNKITFDRIDFSGEKFRWCAKSQYYDSESIKFAIDDSPKHSLEYSRHGIPCYVPIKSYNINVENNQNITMYKNFDDLCEKLSKL